MVFNISYERRIVDVYKRQSYYLRIPARQAECQELSSIVSLYNMLILSLSSFYGYVNGWREKVSYWGTDASGHRDTDNVVALGLVGEVSDE